MNWEAVIALITLICAIVGSASVLIFKAGNWWKGVDKNIERLADKMGEIGDQLKQMSQSHEQRMNRQDDRIENLEVRVSVLEDHDKLIR